MRGLNVYASDGRLVFSTTHPDRIGRRRSSPELEPTSATNEPRADLVDPAGSAPEIVRVWSPLHGVRGRPVGAAEVTLDDVRGERHDLRALGGRSGTRSGSCSRLLWLALAIFVSGASARMRAQNEDLEARSHDLVESSRELEATLLETIETLNAAVEARDPYTAGHSQRVRRVSLAIGRELRLSAKQLGALGTAALFHDIGKIGMPDSILTKPERLEPGRADGHAGARRPRRGDRLAGSPRSRTASRPSGTTTSAGTASATRTGSAARRSRSRRRSSRSRTPGTR